MHILHLRIPANSRACGRPRELSRPDRSRWKCNRWHHCEGHGRPHRKNICMLQLQVNFQKFKNRTNLLSDVFHRTCETGEFSVGTYVQTLSPAMDTQYVKYFLNLQTSDLFEFLSKRNIIFQSDMYLQFSHLVRLLVMIFLCKRQGYQYFLRHTIWNVSCTLL